MSLTCKAKRAMNEIYVTFLLLILSLSILSSFFTNKHSGLSLSLVKKTAEPNAIVQKF